MSRPRCRSTSAHASPHSRVKERIFEAVRMGPVERATSRARTRKRTRIASDISIKASGRRFSRFSPHLVPPTVALPPDPDAHRHVFLSHPRRRRRVQERGPAGFAQGTPPDVDRRSDAVSDPIARIVSGNSIQPEETPSSSRAEQLRTFFALARGRLARRGGIAIHAEVLHLPHASRDMDKKDKNADVYSALPSPLTGPRSAWGSSGASRGRPRRLLWPARSTRTSRSGRMARLGPCSAGGCRRLPFPPAPAKKSARAKN